MSITGTGVDPESGGLIVIQAPQAKVHAGKHWVVSRKYVDLSDTIYASLIISGYTGKCANCTISCTSSDSGEINIYRDFSYSGGDFIDPSPIKIGEDNPPVVTSLCNVNVIDYGSLVMGNLVGYGYGSKSSGGQAACQHEIELVGESSVLIIFQPYNRNTSCYINVFAYET